MITLSDELYSNNGAQVGTYLHGSEACSNLFVCYRQRGRVALYTSAGLPDKKEGNVVKDLVQITRFSGKISRPIAKGGWFKDKPDFYDFVKGMADEHDAAIVESAGFEHQPSEIFKAHSDIYLRAIQLEVLNDPSLSEGEDHKRTEQPEQ